MYRPLTPHVSIYKSQFSSIFSIFHRVTGVTLIAVMMFFWLGLCLISSLRAHHTIYLLTCYLNVQLAWLSVAALSLMGLSLLYHISSGIRHLIWDFYGSHYLNKTTVIKSAYLISAIPILALVVAVIFF